MNIVGLQNSPTFYPQAQFIVYSEVDLAEHISHECDWQQQSYQTQIVSLTKDIILSCYCFNLIIYYVQVLHTMEYISLQLELINCAVFASLLDNKSHRALTVLH